MPGISYFYITRENQIIKVPQPKEAGYKPISSLANEEVIIVELAYETIDRKPVSTLLINFSRVTLDERGAYKISSDEMRDAFNDLDIFSFGASTIAKSKGPLVIPRAKFVPTNEQKAVVIQYIKGKYPDLYQNIAFKIQQFCDVVESRNEKKRKLFKEAARLRKDSK